MAKFTLYVEFFGRKVKHELEASSVEDARHKLYGKIIFHKIKQHPESGEELVNRIFNGFK